MFCCSVCRSCPEYRGELCTCIRTIKLAGVSFSLVFAAMKFVTSLTCVTSAGAGGSKEIKTYYLMDYCGQMFDMGSRGMEEVLLHLEPTGTYQNNVDCQVTFVVRTSYRVMFNILYLKLETCADSLDVYGATVPDNVLCIGICYTPSESFLTPADRGVLRFRSDHSGNQGRLKVLVTVFKNTVGGQCEERYHLCGNSHCIHSDLVCNTRDNCGDDSEEDEERCKVDEWMYTIIAVCSAVPVIIGVTVGISCYMLKKSHKRTVKPMSSAATTYGRSYSYVQDCSQPQAPGPKPQANQGFHGEHDIPTVSPTVLLTINDDNDNVENAKLQGFTYSNPGP